MERLTRSSMQFSDERSYIIGRRYPYVFAVVGDCVFGKTRPEEQPVASVDAGGIPKDNRSNFALILNG